MKVLNRRYQLVAPDGEDHFGVYYRAIDLTNHKEELRIKLLHQDHHVAQLIETYSDEFIKLVAVDHDNILPNYRFDIVTTIDNKPCEEKRYFYVTGYYQQAKLLQYDHLDYDERMFVLLEVCYALQFLHFRGISYGYLTFENLLITRDDSHKLVVKLRDLASICGYLDQGHSVQDKMLQTLAPEVLLREGATKLSDIYSLGVMTYFLTNGIDVRHHTFDRAKQFSHQANLQQLIESTTAYHGEDRLLNMQTFIEKFEVICPYPYTFKDKNHYERLNFNMPIVGREKELALAKGLIEHRLEHMSGSAGIFISGEAGIGKSRFIREVHYALRIQGIRVVSFEVEKGYPGQHDVFAQVLMEIVKQSAVPRPLIDKYGSELVKVLPILREMWNVQPSEPLMGDRELLKLNNRIVSFLLEFAQSTPLVIVLDNIDELGDNELQLLDHLISMNENLPFILVMSYTQMAIGKQINLLSHVQGNHCTQIVIENYSIDEAGIHLQNLLFMDKKPLQLATKIVSEASGNPRYIEEVVKNLFLKNYIYVHDSRKWFIHDDGYDNIEIPQTLDEATLKSIQNFDAPSVSIMESISVFGKPVPKSIILEMVKIESEVFDRCAAQLIELKVLQIKYSDWGYTYDFYNRNLARMIYQKIPLKRRNHYHLCAAQALEAVYKQEGTHGESLLRHLVAAQKTLKAIEYGIKLGDRMSELSILSQALEYYNQALALFGEGEHPQLRARVLKAIANIHFQVGENQQAYTIYHQLVSLADAENMEIVKVDAVLRLCEILLNRKQFEQIEGFFDEIEQLAKALSHRIGLLELGLLKARYFTAVKKHETVALIIKNGLQMASRLQNSYYIGRYLNLQGVLANLEENYEEAFRCFLSSANYLEQSPNRSDLSRAYNNLGVIALEYIADVEKARAYYEKALNILVRHNVVEGRATYLYNLGETYALEGNYEEAIRYYLESEQIAEDTTNVEAQIANTMGFIDAYMGMKNYQEAYRHIQRFEREFEPLAHESRDLGINTFYYLCGLFYMRMREAMLAKAFLEKVLLSEDYLIDTKSRYRYQVTRFVFEYIITERRNSGDVDFVKLDALCSDAKNPIQALYLKDLLLDLALDISCLDDKKDLQEVLKRYSQVEVPQVSDTMRIKQAIALAALEKQGQAQRYEELVHQYDTKLNQENRWLLHMMTGNAYYRDNDLFKALMHHLDALDIVHELTISLPVALRAGYVLNDFMRMRLYEQIQNIKEHMRLRNKEIPITSVLSCPVTLEGYFDLGDMEAVFENADFKRSIQEAYSKRYHLKLTQADDLLRYFKRDQAYNLQLILRYLTQMTLAQSGFVFAVNEYGETEEVFKSDDWLTPIDINTFIKQHYEADNGLVIEHKRRLYTDRILASRKSVIFMPIYNAQDGFDPHMRRRYDAQDQGYHEVLGYLYLESDKLLNNINGTSFEAVRQLNNLLYVMLDNFKLKKAATIDKLTGVFLRKFIETEFNKELAESRLRGHELSVIMADIDHFKTVNDTFGHRKGDEVLFKIGEIIMNSVRHGDYVGRYGGEEFIVILPKTGAMDAYVVSEKIRERVEGGRILGEEHPLTISLGVATFPSMGQTDDELIERADQALYESKNMGRNRTTLYDTKISQSNKRYDKLAGILSGNVSNDARVIKAMIDLVDLISDASPSQEKIAYALAIILDITEGQEAALVVGDSRAWQVHERHRGSEGILRTSRLSNELINSFFQSNHDDYFIHWNDIEDVDRLTGMPNWKSYIVCPLIHHGENKGLIVVRVPIKEREFEFKHYNFVKHLTGVIAALVQEP